MKHTHNYAGFDTIWVHVIVYLLKNRKVPVSSTFLFRQMII